MWRRISGGVFFFLSAVYVFTKKTVEAWFFDHVVHAVTPYEAPLLSLFIEWGVPILLVITGALVLFYGPTPVAADMPSPPTTDDSADDGEKAFERGFTKAALRESGTRDIALLRLAQLRSEGVEIRNDAVNLLFTSHLDAWVVKIRKWMEDVIEALKAVNPADSEWFATLDAVPAARVPIPNVRLGGEADRVLFVSIFRQHDYRLARLDSLLQKYGIGAAG